MIQKYFLLAIVVLLVLCFLLGIMEKFFLKIFYKYNITIFKKEYKIMDGLFKYLNKENFNLCELEFIKLNENEYDLIFNSYNGNGKRLASIVSGKGTISKDILKIELKVTKSYMLLFFTLVLNNIFQLISFLILIYEKNASSIDLLIMFFFQVVLPVVISIKYYNIMNEQIVSIEDTINIYNKAYCA